MEDSRYLKYIKYQLDEFHRNNEENENKIFLFIIHIEINYKNEKIKNNEKSKNKLVNYIEDYYSYFLSYLSEYQQITIDNLFEQRNISVIELFNKANEEFVLMKELFDINLIIKKEFSKQIIGFSPQNKYNNHILDKIDNLLVNGIRELIINKIQISFKNSSNILRTILVNFSLIEEKNVYFLDYLIEKIFLLISITVMLEN